MNRLRCACVIAGLFGINAAKGVDLLLLQALPSPKAQSSQMSIPEIVRNVKFSIAKVIVDGTKKDGSRAEEIGTGFAIDEDGDLLTNCHVVSGVANPTVTVRFMDGTVGGVIFNHRHWDPLEDIFNATKPISATVRGCDQPSDLAVLRLQRIVFGPHDSILTNHWPMPKPLRFADPTSLQVGDEVIIVGFALDISGGPSVNRGIVSGLDRSLEGLFSGLIQTDATINHGNSGGPMLNMRGEVVGVNTYTNDSTVARSEQGDVTVNTPYGIFYARSVATAAPFGQMMIRTGRVVRADPGLAKVRSIDETDRSMFGKASGVQILEFSASSPAQRAGLKPGDIITHINICHPESSRSGTVNTICNKGEGMEDVGVLTNFLATVPPGQKVSVEFWRMPNCMMKAMNDHSLPTDACKQELAFENRILDTQ